MKIGACTQEEATAITFLADQSKVDLMRRGMQVRGCEGVCARKNVRGSVDQPKGTNKIGSTFVNETFFPLGSSGLKCQICVVHGNTNVF